MAAKWKLHFQDQQLRLILKALVFGASFALLLTHGVTFASTVFFLLVGNVLYFFPVTEPRTIVGSFFVFLFIALFTAYKFETILSLSLWLIIASFLFYILLGIKNLFFIQRRRWYYLLYLVLTYVNLLLLFHINRFQWWFWKSFGLFFVTWLLTKDFLELSLEKSTPFQKYRGVATALLSFLNVELLWTISLLPLSFLNSVHSLALGTYITSDVLMNYGNGTLTRRDALVKTTVLILLTILIFVSNQWGL